MTVSDFGPSWRDGNAFIAVVNSIRPGLLLELKQSPNPSLALLLTRPLQALQSILPSTQVLLSNLLLTSLHCGMLTLFVVLSCLVSPSVFMEGNSYKPNEIVCCLDLFLSHLAIMTSQNIYKLSLRKGRNKLSPLFFLCHLKASLLFFLTLCICCMSLFELNCNTL